MFKAFQNVKERDFDNEDKRGVFTLLSAGGLMIQIVWGLVFTFAGAFMAHYICANFFFKNSGENKAYIWTFVVAVSCIVILIAALRILIRMLRTAFKLMEEDQLIINNVSGGTVICHFDDRFTIKSVTPIFYKMFDYNIGDVKKKYRSEFYCMLVGDDSRREFARQKRLLRENGIADAQYKILNGKGESMWVSSHSVLTTGDDFESVVYMVLFDITNEKMALEKLAFAEARNKIVLEKTECCIFEWNIMKDTFEVSDLFISRFGLNDETLLGGNLLHQFVHENDTERLNNCMQKIKNGESDNYEIVVRLKDFTQEYTHNTLTMSVVRDNNDVPIRAVGVIVNIEEQYLKEEELRKRATTDSLTGIYNKGATESMIRSTIDGYHGQCHALLIIDVDDFKNVNDTLGHASGDEALQLVSRTLFEEFRDSDIVGRIGGDEFMVFAVNIDGNENRVAEALDRIKARNMTVSSGNNSIKLTLSIGVSFYKKDDVEYDGLFKKADLALYSSKKNGKDQYTMYSHDLK